MRRLPMQYLFFKAASFEQASASGSEMLRRPMVTVIHASLASAQTAGQVQGLAPEPQLSANAPHSMASDAWKGLIFSLMAGGKNEEALQEMGKIPPDVRQQLEADLDFVQGEASLYLALGDFGRATQTLNRVESFYLLRRSPPPAGLEVQHAWLLYNSGNEALLYPVLQRLDGRAELTSGQRGQVETIWANWGVKRAEIELNGGHLAEGVQLLQAAAQNYPDNLTVRRAVAGAYAKVGRSADALGLFKTIPMEAAGPQDYQAAISSALGATDMIQAEAWLRQALAKFPYDSGVLAEAARFEQARGNAQRAADFWRASLAALPPGSAAQQLDRRMTAQGGSILPTPGDLKQLLDPRNMPGNKPATGAQVPPLPGYHPNSQVKASPESAGGSGGMQSMGPRQNQWLNSPSGEPLPMPAGMPNRSPNAGQTPPVYFQQSSQGTTQGRTTSGQPVLIEQSFAQGQQTVIKPAKSGPAISESSSGTVHVHVQGQPGVGALAAPKDANTKYMGKMNLPPEEQNIETTDGLEHAGSAGTGPTSAGQPGSARNVASITMDVTPPVALRIASRPMGAMAAQVQALMAEQTDSQLTQGSAATIHGIPNAMASTTANAGGTNGSPNGTMIAAQYTPSAQEAATGAYSAPKPQATPQPETTAPAKPSPAAKKKTRMTAKARKKAAATKTAQGSAAQGTQTLANAPTTEAQLPVQAAPQQQT
jgi:hypothetical protein